jgi:hypothetical protein
VVPKSLGQTTPPFGVSALTRSRDLELGNLDVLASEEAPRIRGAAVGSGHRECGAGVQPLMKPSSSGLTRLACVVHMPYGRPR